MVYIAHMNIVVFLQAGVEDWQLPISVKYFLVFPAATVLSYLVARRVVMPLPRVAAGMAVVFAAGMALWFR
jgi:hypothetical protein